jgi:hypothetical protein
MGDGTADELPIEEMELLDEGASHGRNRFTWRLGLALAIFILASVVAAIIGLVAEPAAEGTENEVQELGGGTGWASLGIAIGVVFLGWAYLGVKILQPFPKWIRGHRIEIHNWISIIALALALFHGIELMGLGDFRGWLSGWIATGLMGFLFVHGWWKRYFVGLWGLKLWRILHWEGALGVIALSLMHWLLIERAKELAGGG